jgi:hypothetical protein
LKRLTASLVAGRIFGTSVNKNNVQLIVILLQKDETANTSKNALNNQIYMEYIPLINQNKHLEN